MRLHSSIIWFPTNHFSYLNREKKFKTLGALEFLLTLIWRGIKELSKARFKAPISHTDFWIRIKILTQFLALGSHKYVAHWINKHIRCYQRGFKAQKTRFLRCWPYTLEICRVTLDSLWDIFILCLAKKAILAKSYQRFYIDKTCFHLPWLLVVIFIERGCLEHSSSPHPLKGNLIIPGAEMMLIQSNPWLGDEMVVSIATQTGEA